MVPTTVPTTTKKGRQTRQINIGRQAEALKSRMGKKKIAERKRSWEEKELGRKGAGKKKNKKQKQISLTIVTY